MHGREWHLRVRQKMSNKINFLQFRKYLHEKISYLFLSNFRKMWSSYPFQDFFLEWLSYFRLKCLPEVSYYYNYFVFFIHLWWRCDTNTINVTFSSKKHTFASQIFYSSFKSHEMLLWVYCVFTWPSKLMRKSFLYKKKTDSQMTKKL